jgi:serine/threonine-protein kinase RsbW
LSQTMCAQQASILKEICISSHPSNIVQIENFVENFREEHGISEDVYGNMLVAIIEAANNAIIHGNETDHSKQVSVCLQRERNIITCIIRDEGSGFDFNHVPDPTAPENIEKEGGRGIFLMKHLSDLVVFSNDGSHVEIQFRV